MMNNVSQHDNLSIRRKFYHITEADDAGMCDVVFFENPRVYKTEDEFSEYDVDEIRLRTKWFEGIELDIRYNYYTWLELAKGGRTI